MDACAVRLDTEQDDSIRFGVGSPVTRSHNVAVVSSSALPTRPKSTSPSTIGFGMR